MRNTDCDLQVGDRVCWEANGNRVGTVVQAVGDGWVGVAFDEHDDAFHNLDGLCKEGHGYWLYDDMLTLIETSYTPEPLEPLDIDRLFTR